jgi:hypothetical protein
MAIYLLNDNLFTKWQLIYQMAIKIKYLMAIKIPNRHKIQKNQFKSFQKYTQNTYGMQYVNHLATLVGKMAFCCKTILAANSQRSRRLL